MRLQHLRHEFVDLLPPSLEPGVLYVSIKYKNMVHLCCCGCGSKVVTPISPTGWQLTYDGKSVSVYPSIGSWQLACRSHYWIEGNRINWAEQWSPRKIEAGYARDRLEKDRYYGSKPSGSGKTSGEVSPAPGAEPKRPPLGIFDWLTRWLS